MMIRIAFLAGCYLLGSIPTGYLIVRLAQGRDVRRFGSGATGATNVLRLGGVLFAVPVVVVDVLKGFVPACLAMHWFGDIRLSLAAGALAVLGHCFPVSIGFRGGKGVATAMGVFLFLCFPGALLSLAVFGITIALTRYVSLGSLLGVFSFPIWSLLFLSGTVVFYGSGILALIVVFRHGGNIERLITGRERKLGRKTEGSEG
jgi:glycerol-3-phosphate acyltransferase PlsY